MMNFRVVKDQIVKILGDESKGRYKVWGYQKQSKSSDEILNNNRSVQVYYSDGVFTKSNNRRMGSKTHDITYEIDLSGSAAAKGDLTVLESATSTADQRAVALSAIREAAEIADKKIDELLEIIYQILMDARNADLQLTPGLSSSRWIGSIQKDTVLENGDLVVKTANMKYTCRVQEDVTGAAGNEPDTVYFSTEISTTDIDETGVTENIGVDVENDNT